MSKLIMAGHSFGGITAIGATNKDSRITACIPMDPWFFPYKNEYDTLNFKTPIFNI